MSESYRCKHRNKMTEFCYLCNEQGFLETKIAELELKLAKVEELRESHGAKWLRINDLPSTKEMPFCKKCSDFGDEEFVVYPCLIRRALDEEDKNVI
jgi:hypothetical protein